MSESSSSYESANESLNSDRSDSIHSDDSRDMAWHLDDLNDESGFMSHNQREHSSRRHRDSRQVLQAEIVVNLKISMDYFQRASHIKPFFTNL
jgi:hypothetical protein